MNVTGPSSKAQAIALHLVACEAIGKDHSAALQVCEKLRGPLSVLAGAAGFRSLLVRALTLAKREASTLDIVEVRDDGSLEGLSCGATEPGGTLLVAQLLGLLMTFVGEALTMRLLQKIWPDAPNTAMKAGKEEAA